MQKAPEQYCFIQQWFHYHVVKQKRNPDNGVEQNNIIQSPSCLELQVTRFPRTYQQP